MKKVYRYVTNGEGVWSAGKRLLPKELIDEVNENRKWLKKPDIGEGNFRFWLTEKGKKKYEETLLNSHRKYLPNIKLEHKAYNEIKKIKYEDEFQVVEQI